jgi:tRNA pseudouridine55 synthase
MLTSIIVVNKKVGQTPLDCIIKLKRANPNMANLSMTYAGRLDPLAEGVLVILTGDECMKKDEYLKLSKEYEVDILFGFATDTYDVMGKVIQNTPPENEIFERSSDLLAEVFGKLGQTISNSSFSGFASRIQKILPEFTGKFSQSYPPYSSRPINGKPLFQWAREGRLNEIEIPTHGVFVEKIEIIKENFIRGDNLLEKIKNNISQVKGDFRQEEIIKIWEDNLKNKKEEKYKIITLRISCGGGVYVRGIAHSLGEKLGVPALALRIVRTKVGEYKIAVS